MPHGSRSGTDSNPAGLGVRWGLSREGTAALLGLLAGGSRPPPPPGPGGSSRSAEVPTSTQTLAQSTTLAGNITRASVHKMAAERQPCGRAAREVEMMLAQK
ncbi:Hypothetical predicted protein [Pelobates cultripes]|uniref:Uncharacterized protein n=1 Tax=Pelobates cultripes TaxID=61616 RepID=A0AAD1QX73_PELCU|nr:Hypothetical predicted protein [Pelobates cultripes]